MTLQKVQIILRQYSTENAEYIHKIQTLHMHVNSDVQGLYLLPLILLHIYQYGRRYCLDVKFITTTSADLHTLPIVDGQIIAVSDKANYLYDMGSSRYQVSRLEMVSELPSIGISGVLYLRVNDGAMYQYNTATFERIGEPNFDNKSYVRRNGEWHLPNYIYECSNTSDDGSNISAILNKFINAGVSSLYVSIQGTFKYGVSGNNIVINLPDVLNLYLDFYNTTFTGNSTISNLLQITNNGSNVHISGLSKPFASNIINMSGNGRLYVDNCTVSNAAGISTVVTSTNDTYVSNCTFDISTTINPAIEVISEDSIVTVANCNFISTSATTQGRAVRLPSADHSKLQVYNNSLPADSVVAGDQVIDVKFTNICP